ncbi:TPA: Gp15 family bacteriophage protein [Bacillus tropicus]
MFKLTDRSRDIYKWSGIPIELNLSFDNVLKLMELFDDSTIPIQIKPVIALNMLVVEKLLLTQLDENQKEKLFLNVFKDKLGIDLSLSGKRNEKTKSNDDNNSHLPNIPIVNFTIDAERIYASFLFDYGINLFEKQGEMQWDEFLALFNNLSEKSPMKIAMHYRTCEIPKKDKNNADERKRIKKMKELYELPEAKAIREAMELAAFQKRMDAQKKQGERQVK